MAREGRARFFLEELKNAMAGRYPQQLIPYPREGWTPGIDGNSYWESGGPNANMYRYNQATKTMERFDIDQYEWSSINVKEQKDVESSDLAKYRTLGSPSVLQVRMDTNRCILTNLIWNIGESPEIAKVIAPGSGVRTQIAHKDLMKKPFMIEVNNDMEKNDEVIQIQFDHASMACDNQVAVCDMRKITRDCATVLNILRTIKAMTRMYPSIHDSEDNKCRTQQENFVCLAKVSENMWKVKSTQSRRR